MKYKYYSEIETDAHYPTAVEIARMLGIHNEKGDKFHSHYVIAALSELDNEKLYYLGSKGKTRVFRNTDNIVSFGFNIYARISMVKADKHGLVRIQIPAAGKKYKLIIDRKAILDFVNGTMMKAVC